MAEIQHAQLEPEHMDLSLQLSAEPAITKHTLPNQFQEKAIGVFFSNKIICERDHAHLQYPFTCEGICKRGTVEAHQNLQHKLTAIDSRIMN